MIKVVRYINKDHKIIGFKCKGHAKYAEYGQDLVCCAVSVLVINTVNSINEFTDDTFDYKEDEKTGMIHFMINSNLSKESEVLLKSLFLGLEKVQDSYGKKYIRLETK